jgi:hypothetical protein
VGISTEECAELESWLRLTWEIENLHRRSQALGEDLTASAVLAALLHTASVLDQLPGAASADAEHLGELRERQTAAVPDPGGRLGPYGANFSDLLEQELGQRIGGMEGLQVVELAKVSERSCNGFAYRLEVVVHGPDSSRVSTPRH